MVPKRRAGLTAWQWSLVFLVLVCAAIEILARSGVVSHATLVPFTQMVYEAGVLLITPGFYASALFPSLFAIVVAFVVASVLGVILGYVIWRLPAVRRALDAYLTAYYALPVFALYPVLIAIWGQGTAPIATLAVIFAIVTVIMNAMNGFDGVPSIVDKLARSLDVSETVYFLRFFLPYALPSILVGLRLAFLYSLLSVLSAEFLLSTQGIGFFISTSYLRFQIGPMYGAVIIVVVIAVGVDRLLALLTRRVSWAGGTA